VNKLLGRHVGIVSDVKGQLERASGFVDFDVEHIIVLLALVQLLTRGGLHRGRKNDIYRKITRTSNL
jgi:hypothetical protein